MTHKLIIDDMELNPDDLTFGAFKTVPQHVEAVQMLEPFQVHKGGRTVKGEIGDWLIRRGDRLFILSEGMLQQSYRPVVLSELEAELDLCRVGTITTFSAHDDEPLDISNPPSDGTAVTPPPLAWEQPKPVRGKRLVAQHARDMFEAVLQHQEAKGLTKYGTPLETFNGRDALLDLLCELADAVMYCTQAILEKTDSGVQDGWYL